VTPEKLADLRRRAGIPDGPPSGPPTADEIAEYLTEQARTKLNELIPAAFRGPVPADERMETWVRAYIAKPLTAPSLLLYGPTGSGKSHQAYAALSSAVLGCYALRMRPRWRAVDHSLFADRMRPSQDEGDPAVWYERYSRADLLLFDDLGAAHTKEWGLDRLQSLVDYRWRNALPTIWTTNLSGQSLKAAFGDRVVSRIWDSRRLSFDGRPDHRRAS
jgi:DNA replication protein DnaC